MAHPGSPLNHDTAEEKLQSVRADNSNHSSKKIAIIGSGIAGISTAYHLQTQLELSKTNTLPSPVTIQIFEKDPQIGGRIDSTFLYKDQITPADIGAYTFDADDDILAKMFSSIDDFHPKGYPRHWSGILSSDQLDRISLWDGERLATSAMEGIPFSWTNAAKLIMEHALYPKFWSDFARFYRIALSDEGVNGFYPEDFIEDEVGVYYTPVYGFREPNFLERWRDIVRAYAVRAFWAASRARFGPRKEILRGLSEAYGINTNMKKQNTTIISRGYGTGLSVVLNKLVDQLEGKRQVVMNLNSAVTNIIRQKNETFDIHWTKTSTSDGSKTKHMEIFDSVVIEAPYHQSAIRIEPPLHHTPTNITYTPTWATQFTIQGGTTMFNMKGSLDGEAFGSVSGISPEIIWSLKGEGEGEGMKKAHPASACNIPSFISIARRDHPSTDGCVSGSENLYQVLSREPFSDGDIAAIVKKCGRAREQVTFPDQACHPWKLKKVTGLFEGEKFDPEFDEIEYLGVNSTSVQVEIGSGESPNCLYASDITIRSVHRRYWPDGLVDTRGHADENSRTSEDPWKLASGLFYTSEFEGRDGPSVSGSVYNGKRVADLVEADYV